MSQTSVHSSSGTLSIRSSPLNLFLASTVSTVAATDCTGAQLREATPHPKSGVAAERSNAMSKERLLHGCRRAERSYSTFKVRRGGPEEIPLVQGKEQELHFAGAAMKRYSTSKVREIEVRW